jgi:hypothetical protein
MTKRKDKGQTTTNMIKKMNNSNRIWYPGCTPVFLVDKQILLSLVASVIESSVWAVDSMFNLSLVICLFVNEISCTYCVYNIASKKNIL